MQKPLWLLFFLSLVIPSGAIAQTQDVHALRIVTQTLEKAKKDNKTRQDNTVLKKTHRITNLNPDGNFKSVEKHMIYGAYTKKVNNKVEYVEELTYIWPPKTEPAPNLLDFDKLLDAFLSRFYFSVNPEKEIINGRSHLKIHFWPRGDALPPPTKEGADYVVNHIIGILYIDEETLILRTIAGHLKEIIDESLWFYMDRFDFNIEITDWKGLGLIARMEVVAKYQYRDPRKNFWSLFSPVKRSQMHQFWYEYGIE